MCIWIYLTSLFLLFLIALNVYLYFQKSIELDIYEYKYTTNKELQELCDCKQPILISSLPIICQTNFNLFMEMGSEFDICIHNSNNNTMNILELKSANILFYGDVLGYYSEHNTNFIDEIGMTKFYTKMSRYLQPPLILSTSYDVLFGVKDQVIPLQFHKNYRTFLSAQTGTFRVRMTPYKSIKYLDVNKKCDPFGNNLSGKLKFTECLIRQNQFLFIPAFYWYSIQFLDTNTTICSFTYNSFIGSIINS